MHPPIPPGYAPANLRSHQLVENSAGCVRHPKVETFFAEVLNKSKTKLLNLPRLKSKIYCSLSFWVSIKLLKKSV